VDGDSAGDPEPAADDTSRPGAETDVLAALDAVVAQRATAPAPSPAPSPAPGPAPGPGHSPVVEPDGALEIDEQPLESSGREATDAPVHDEDADTDGYDTDPDADPDTDTGWYDADDPDEPRTGWSGDEWSDDSAGADDDDAAHPEESLRVRRSRSGASRLALPAVPPIPAHVAAMVAGAVAGLLTVLIGFLAAKGCDAVGGSDGCGGGLGLLALILILAIEVFIGAKLLQLWRITDPYSTSFLGVGLVAMVAMLVFLDSIDSAWMLLVIPVLTALAYLLSWWVTVRFVEEPGR
jgi:hypothetical protein